MRWSSGEEQSEFGFTSQRNEAGFRLMDYQARMYSPLLGRFVSPDSIVPEPGGSQGWNRYAYVDNNPLRHIDPTGHDGCDPIPGVDCIEKTEQDNGPTLTVRHHVVLSPGSEAYSTEMIREIESQIPTQFYQDEIDNLNRFGNALGVPLAIAGETTYLVNTGNMNILEIQALPDGIETGIPTPLAKASTVMAGGIPLAIGTATGLEINKQYNQGMLNKGQYVGQHFGNVTMTSAVVALNTVVIPAAASLTSAPITVGATVGLAAAYDASVIQGSINNRLAGQGMVESFVNARAETHRSFGISYWWGE